jgi:hypothetical protein
LYFYDLQQADKHPQGRIAMRRAPRRGFLFSPSGVAIQYTAIAVQVVA